MDFSNPDTIQDIMQNLAEDFNKQFEDAVTVGLKLKGFEFNTRNEILEFIKQRCSSADDINLKQITYYIDNKPFFLYNYKTEIGTRTIEDTRATMYSSYGSFAYL